jgi:O-6-methylguanine DNA methyltransferase
MEDATLCYGRMDSPVGVIQVAATQQAVVALTFVGENGEGAAAGAGTMPNAVVEDALAQLADYFAGRQRGFHLALALRGTSFQRQVWQAVQTVPYGGMVSYATIATAIGKPQAVRAVGAANGANPVAIIVPCHRVVGSDGSLTGYGGGLWRKAWLLEHESTYG